MEQLAERRMQREEDTQYNMSVARQTLPGHNHPPLDEDEDYDEEDDEEEDVDDDYDSQEEDYEEEDDMVSLKFLFVLFLSFLLTLLLG